MSEVFEGLDTENLQKDTERERREGERHSTARKTGHGDNRRRGGERLRWQSVLRRWGTSEWIMVVSPAAQT